jgi:hypothetical protein
MALDVDIYKATTKYGTEHLQEDNMDDLLEELRLMEIGRSGFFCVGRSGVKIRVENGTIFHQRELKNYLLSLPDKTLLNGKKDIVKVLRGYIERGQLNWIINERTSHLKDGTVKKQTISITVRSFPCILPPSPFPDKLNGKPVRRYIPPTYWESIYDPDRVRNSDTAPQFCGEVSVGCNLTADASVSYSPPPVATPAIALPSDY